METVEKLSITSLSGNDTLTTQPGITLPITIDAGSGNDTITTGDGADLINGGDGNDTLNGAGGGDRIVGDRGGDTMNGGAGDDTTVWNNGDGSDVMNGDDGVDRVETNLSAGADTSTLKLENGRVRYDRLNPGPFNLSIATAEVFELNALGGDDTLTTAADVTLPLVVDAGAGNDTIQGGAAQRLDRRRRRQRHRPAARGRRRLRPRRPGRRLGDRRRDRRGRGRRRDRRPPAGASPPRLPKPGAPAHAGQTVNGQRATSPP